MLYSQQTEQSSIHGSMLGEKMKEYLYSKCKEYLYIHSKRRVNFMSESEKRSVKHATAKLTGCRR